MQLVVVKRSGVVEPFSRDKVVAGVRKACKGRPVTEAQLAKLGQQVEESLRASGQAEVPTAEVGIAILGPLKELDSVAYLRFASVYRNFESVDDFRREIDELEETAAPALVSTPESEISDDVSPPARRRQSRRRVAPSQELAEESQQLF